MMADQQPIRLCPDLRDSRVWDRVLVTGVMPHIPVSSVDFLVLKLNPAAPIEEISQPSRLMVPDALDLLAPS